MGRTISSGRHVVRLGLAALLLGTFPLGATGDTPEDWVRRLGDRDFAVREQATRELRRLGIAAIPALLTATASETPEVAARARRTLRRIETTATPTNETLRTLEVMSRSSRTDVAELATRLVPEIHRRQRIVAMNERVAALVVRIRAREPSPEVLEEFASVNYRVGSFETCLAHVRLAKGHCAVLGDEPRNRKLVEREREVLSSLDSARYPADDFSQRAHCQAILATCSNLLDADVPEEADRLARELPDDHTPLLPGDLTKASMLVAIELHMKSIVVPPEFHNDVSGAASLGEAAAKLLSRARAQLKKSEYHEAGRIARFVAQLDVAYGLFKDRPDLVLADVERLLNPHPQPAPAPEAFAW